MGSTEPTDVRDTSPTVPARGRPAATPPAGLPPPPRPGSPAPSGQRIPVPSAERARWYDPRPFYDRHEMAILRTLAVIAVIFILLLLWQGVAHGDEEKGGAPTEGVIEDDLSGGDDGDAIEPDSLDDSDDSDGESVFDPAKLEAYLEEQRARRAVEAARAPSSGAPGPAAPASPSPELGAVPPPAGARAQPGAPAATGPVPTPTPANDTDAPGSGPLLPHPPLAGVPAPQPPAPPEGPPPPTPLGAIAAEELVAEDAFSLALSLQSEFAEVDAIAIPALRAELHRHLLDYSRLAARGDNPLERLDALLELLGRSARIQVVPEDTLATLLPGRTLVTHRAGPHGWCLLALALADRLRGLELEPVLCAGTMGLRYENGAHRYVITPVAPDRVLSDREFARLAAGSDGAEILALTRPELCGRWFAIGGIDRIAAGAWPRGLELIDRALGLDPRQPRALLALARARTERGERALALEALAAATALDPDDRSARRLRVDLLLELGRAEEAAADLEFLASAADAPAEDVLRRAEFLLERGEAERAHGCLAPLSARVLPPDLAGRAAHLERAALAAPWIAILSGSEDDRARLAATRRLARLPGPATEEALLAALDDPNGRLASSALAALRTVTGIAVLPLDAAACRRALSGR